MIECLGSFPTSAPRDGNLTNISHCLGTIVVFLKIFIYRTARDDFLHCVGLGVFSTISLLVSNPKYKSQCWSR